MPKRTLIYTPFRLAPGATLQILGENRTQATVRVGLPIRCDDPPPPVFAPGEAVYCYELEESG